MKRYYFVILFMFFLVGCSSTNLTDEVKVLVPNGIPLIAVGGLVEKENITIEAVAGPDLLISGMISKSHDIIIAPLNIGAKVYATGSTNYQLDAIITTGNTYIVSRKTDSLKDINDLNFKEILAYGRNATPDIILRKALALNNINTNITYLGGIDQVIPSFVGNPYDPNDMYIEPPKYILCAEPILSKLEIEYGMELNILNLQDELKKEIDLIPQAAIFVNKESENIESINKVLALIESNVEDLNNNSKEYAQEILNKHQYFKNLTAVIIENSIPRSNIIFKKVNKGDGNILKYFNILLAFNPDLLGKNIPDEDFYRS